MISCEGPHEHTFDKEKTSAEYLCEAYDCKETYYYSCACVEKGSEVFTVYAHDFSGRITNAEYFAKDSTETTATEYYPFCTICGKKSTETYEYGRKGSERASVGSNTETASITLPRFVTATTIT